MMQAKTLNIHVEPEASDYQRVLLWYQFKRLLVTTIIISVVLAAVLFFALMQVETAIATQVWILVLAALIILPLVIFGNAFLTARKQARRIAAATEPMSYGFDESGATIATPTSRTNFLWERIHKVIETADDFVVFPQQDMFYPLPKRFFDDSQIDALRTLMREGLGEKAKLFK